MSVKTMVVHVRVDENIKLQAAETLATMGLTISDAVREFLARVAADQKLPFDINVPNAVTRAAMLEADELIKAWVKRQN